MEKEIGITITKKAQMGYDTVLGTCGFSVGDYCTVFDGNRWMKTGDIGNNESFWVNALITGFRKTEYNELLVDVVFDNGKESKGHYIEGVRHCA